MSQTPSFREELISQIPVLRLLMAMGYQYLTPEEALALRGGKKGNVILEGVLEPWLKAHNQITFKGQTCDFSQANIHQAIETLRDEPLVAGLLPTNERVYELLTLGTSLKQTIDGDSKSFSLHYIDWEHPENNVYHVTDEFPVEKPGSYDSRYPDIVLFVNGIPLVVIECKRPDLEKESGKAVEEAISQMLRNQRADEIPNLFVYSQLLLAVSVNDALFATTCTSKKYWSVWREQANGVPADIDPEVHPLINQPLGAAEKDRLYNWRDGAYWVRRHFEELESAGERLPTEQDRTLYSLLRPARLLELIYQYVVYDAGVKKIARYQQYFAVQETVRRVIHLNNQGMRTGGVIWHTTGSGKSLTMVMLAKALVLHPNIKNPRIIIVTDRVDLDDQIWRTFRACGKRVDRAKSGPDLTRMIRRSNVDIITTVINKFETVAKRKARDEDVNLFILVDEGHRSQYGSIHAKMRQVFPMACYIGFTGTPLLKEEKSTAAKFGGFIHKYSMRQAAEDNAVVPLLYEGRMAELSVDQEGIDRWFERVTRDLSDDQKLDLKHKFSRDREISQADQRIQQIAYDISQHYAANFQGTGFKAQLAVSSKAMALKYKRYLDDFGMLTSEVIISPPDTREGHEEVDESQTPELQAFWKRMMARFGSEKAYNRELIGSFGRADGVEMLIVVDKLLVGFDEPRNTVLYIDKPLKEHSLLQAIARVNRLFEGKDFGYIIDYRGVLGELNQAMETYNALEGYDTEDVAGAITDIAAEIARLPQLHSDLWAVFKAVPNKKDVEALQRFLAAEDVRQAFYDALTAFARSLKVALSSVAFYESTPEHQVRTYKDDLRFFHNLRVAVKQRYAEAIDYKDYERKVRKLLDSHIQSPDVLAITEQVNIFNVEQFQAEVDRIVGTAAKADTIAHRVKRTVTEHMEKDPAFYKKFSKLIDETIQAYREGRISELEYLKRVTETMQAVRSGRDASLPEKLHRYRDAPAYYGVIHEPLGQYTVGTPQLTVDDLIADVAIRLEQIIEDKKIRDWTTNLDVQNEIKLAIEDYLYSVKGRYDIPLTGVDIDLILDNVIEVAKQRERM
jgi:type I restriction enzyme R subunit